MPARQVSSTGAPSPSFTQPLSYRRTQNTGLGVGGGGDEPPDLPVRNQARGGSWLGMGVLTSFVAVFTNPQTEMMAYNCIKPLKIR